MESLERILQILLSVLSLLTIINTHYLPWCTVPKLPPPQLQCTLPNPIPPLMAH